jgi:hypothetical protein
MARVHRGSDEFASECWRTAAEGTVDFIAALLLASKCFPASSISRPKALADAAQNTRTHTPV